MTGVLLGFAVISGIALVGYLCARVGLFDETAQEVLARVAFFVASPCLLLSVLAKTPVHQVFSERLVVAAATFVVTAAVYLLVARRWWPQDLGGSVIGCLCAAYVNSANLGIPVAAYVLGDISVMAAPLLLQLVLVTPVAMTLMDVDALGHRPGALEVVGRLVRNPLTVAPLVGVALSLAAVELPEVLMRPIETIGQMAVPAMLLAFGISLHTGPRPGASGSTGHVAWLAVCKLGVQPITAYLLGSALGLRGPALLAVVVTAALPTAQNVFAQAVRYGRGTLVARDTILVTTLASAPVILAVALALG